MMSNLAREYSRVISNFAELPPGIGFHAAVPFHVKARQKEKA